MKKKSYNYLFETCKPQRVKIIEEGVSSDGIPKVVFKANLQTADERNQNRRVYSKRICESIVSQLKDKALSRSLLMEVD